MRSLVIDGSGGFGFADWEPLMPHEDEVVVDVLAGGICGTDLEILHGNMIYFTSGAASYPVVPGHEWTGVVRAIGSAVSQLAPGDNVVGEVSIGCRQCMTCLTGNYHRCVSRVETGILNKAGGFAEQIVLPAAFLHKISSDVPLRSAALVEPAAVAFNGVRRARVSPSDQVAIFGDGPIGLLIAQISRIFGARSIVLVGAADTRMGLARTLDIDVVFDARKGKVVERLREACNGSLPDVVFEASGSPSAIKDAIAATTPGGRLVLQGFCGNRRVDGFNVDPIIVNDLTIIGALGSPGVWPDVIRLIEAGSLNPSAIVTDEFPIRKFGDAIQRIESQEAVKVVLRMDGKAAWCD